VCSLPTPPPVTAGNRANTTDHPSVLFVFSARRPQLIITTPSAFALTCTTPSLTTVPPPPPPPRPSGPLRPAVQNHIHPRSLLQRWVLLLSSIHPDETFHIWSLLVVAANCLLFEQFDMQAYPYRRFPHRRFRGRLPGPSFFIPALPHTPQRPSPPPSRSSALRSLPKSPLPLVARSPHIPRPLVSCIVADASMQD